VKSGQSGSDRSVVVAYIICGLASNFSVVIAARPWRVKQSNTLAPSILLATLFSKHQFDQTSLNADFKSSPREHSLNLLLQNFIMTGRKYFIPSAHCHPASLLHASNMSRAPSKPFH
jgi:hypothetical protein